MVHQLLTALARTHEKVVIASKFCRVLGVLKAMCECCRWKCVVLDGNVTKPNRKALIDAFNSSASSTFVMLLSSKVGGEGINLVGASRLILYDPDHNPSKDTQVQGRLWRPGQKAAHVYTYRLLSTGTCEEIAYQRQQAKMVRPARIAIRKGVTRERGEPTTSSQRSLGLPGLETWMGVWAPRETKLAHATRVPTIPIDPLALRTPTCTMGLGLHTLRPFAHLS